MQNNDNNSFEDTYLDLLNRLEISYDSKAYKDLLIDAMSNSFHNNSTLADLLEVSEGTIRNVLNPNIELPPAARIAVYLLLSSQNNSNLSYKNLEAFVDKLDLIKFIIEQPSDKFEVSTSKFTKEITIVPV